MALGPDGTSDDETDDELSTSDRNVYRQNKPQWRAVYFEQLLSLIDRARLRDHGEKLLNGNRPRHRVRTETIDQNEERVPGGLPYNCYNLQWLNLQPERVRLRVKHLAGEDSFLPEIPEGLRDHIGHE
jgi:hypothetical protein